MTHICTQLARLLDNATAIQIQGPLVEADITVGHGDPGRLENVCMAAGAAQVLQMIPEHTRNPFVQRCAGVRTNGHVVTVDRATRQGGTACSDSKINAKWSSVLVGTSAVCAFSSQVSRTRTCIDGNGCNRVGN
jgi:hypothetical protein